MKTYNSIFRQILFAAAPLVLLAGCSDKDDPAPIGVAGVEMSKPTLELSLDGTERLTATVTPDNAADKALAWISSDEAVATVSAEGLVTAVRAGHTTITAVAGGKTGTCALTVNPDIYTASMESTGIGKQLFVVRKNGETLYTLPESMYATSVFFSGGEVYAAGFDRSADQRVAKVWKNDKVLYTLTGKELFNDDFLIFVSGGDVYTSGYESCGNGKSAARIWKNNTELYDLTGNFVTANIRSIFISGSDVYAAGGAYDGTAKNRVKVWKNGTVLHNLTDGMRNAVVYSLFVSGSDVYTAGYENNENDNRVAKVWKNDKLLYTLSDGTYSVYTDSVCVWDGDVYATADGIVWKNGTALYSAPGSYFLEVSVRDGDVYAADWRNKESSIKIRKNDKELYSLSAGSIIKIFVYNGPER